MTRVLIAYGTVEGQTARIAGEMREALAGAGHQAELLHVTQRGDELPEDVDAVIVGGPIHAGHYPKHLVAFAKAHRERLAGLTTGFFTVCLSAAEDTEESRAATAGYVRSFRDATGWTPGRTAVFAGRLAWTQYDFFTRLIMKLITRHQGVADQDVKRDYDYTDYDAVRAFALQVVASGERAAVA